MTDLGFDPFADGETVTIVDEFRRENVLTGLWFRRWYIEGQQPPEHWDLWDGVLMARTTIYDLKPPID